MMNSYMIDIKDYLIIIINREIISQDIDDFEYISKKEYSGYFHVLNEPNRFELIKCFFNPINLLYVINGKSYFTHFEFSLKSVNPAFFW